MTTTPAPSIAASPLTGTATGPFPTGFKYGAAADVRVYLELAGVRQPDLTSGSDYTLTGATPLVDGGTVTLSSGLVPAGGWDEDAGDRVVIYRRTIKSQALALPNSEGHKPAATEAALDKQMRTLEEQADALDLTVRAPVGETGLTLEPATAREGGVAVFGVGGAMTSAKQPAGRIALWGSTASAPLTSLSIEEAAQTFKGDPGGSAMAVGLFTALGSLSIPVGTDLIQTSGYDAVGVGAARYAAVSAGPATAWRAQSANGRWFELAEAEVRASQVGAVGYAHADAVKADVAGVPDYDPSAATVAAPVETTALQALLDCAAALKIPARVDAGRAYRIGAALTAAAGVTVRGEGATLATTATHDMIQCGSAVTVTGLRLVGPGAAYLANSRGITAWGTKAVGAGVAPTRISGPVIEGVEVRGVGSEAVDVRYATGGWCRFSHLHGVGYFGVLALSTIDFWTDFNTIERLAGETLSGQLNAYGVAYTRDTTDADLTRAPVSRGGGARNNIVRDVPTWHAIDTHGGAGHVFSDNVIEDCRRAVVLTHGSGSSPINCRVLNNRAVNAFAHGATNSNGSEKRDSAFWEIGYSPSNRARGNVWRGNYCHGFGVKTLAYGAVFLENADVDWADNVDEASYTLGVRVNGEVSGRFGHKSINTRTPGTGAGGVSNIPYGLGLFGNNIDLDLQDYQTERSDPSVDTYVLDSSVIDHGGTGRTVRLRGLAQKYEAVNPGVLALVDDSGLFGDRTRLIALTVDGFSDVSAANVVATRMGPRVTLSFPDVAGTSDTTGLTLTALPAELRPPVARHWVVRVANSGTDAFGYAVLGTDGVLTVYPSAAAGGAWTASGTKRLWPCSLTYSLETAA